MENATLTKRFEALKSDVEQELLEIDNEIMGVESLQDASWKNWTGQAVAEKKQAILKEKMAWKARTKERVTGKVRDFTASLLNERERRTYPLRYSTAPADNRKSEALDVRAKMFLEAIKGDPDKLRTEWESAVDPEYVSHLVYWTGVLSIFAGKPEGAEVFVKLRQAWELALGLPDLEKLVKRSKALQVRLRESYLRTELGFVTKPKDFWEYDRQMRMLEERQAEEDRANVQAVGLKYDNGLVPKLH